MKKKYEELFERKSDDKLFFEYIKKIRTKLNYNNFVTFFNFGKKLYNSHEFVHYERYVFMLLKV